METLSSVAKRKKRKTRKCLDEIRKRSRRNANDSLLEPSPKLNTVSKPSNINGINPKICITSNRLTLAMFPKVIRSETITRPVLSEITEDPVMNFENIIKNTKSINNEPSNSYKLDEPSQSDSDYIQYSEDNSISSTCERFSPAGQMSIQKDSDSGNLTTQDNNNNNSPGSFLLFSPVDQREDSDMFEVSPETLSTTSTSSHSTQEAYGYQLYEEFMSEIPMYLKQNASALIKDDAMKRTKSQLHDIYLDSCRRESEENILHSMRKRLVKTKSFAPKETTNQSPLIDYQPISRVKRSRAETDHIVYNNSGHESFYEPDRHPLYGELNCHISHDKPDHHTAYDRSLLRSTYETPDYTYYPHKLNQ